MKPARRPSPRRTFWIGVIAVAVFVALYCLLARDGHDQRRADASWPPDLVQVTPEHWREDDVLRVPIDVAAGDESWLLTVAARDADAPLTLVELLAPDGTTVHREDPYDESVFDSRIAGASWSSVGELAVYLPLDGRPPMPGRWLASIALEPDAGLRRVGVLRRRASADDGPRRFSFALGIADVDSPLLDAVGEDGLIAGLRRTMRSVLLPHRLDVGSIERVRYDGIERSAVLDVDGDAMGAACRALHARLDDPLVVPVLLLERFSSDEDPHIAETVGLAPQPGMVGDPDAGERCVALALDAWPIEGPDAVGVDTTLELLGATLLHEAAHLMGLDHASEANGLVFDRLPDTPECVLSDVDGRDHVAFDVAGDVDGVIDDFECDRAGGASNLMFWSGVPEFAPYTLTPMQAAVMRRHPLARPTGDGVSGG